MARNPHRRTPIRTLLAMLVITLGLAGFLLAVNRWGEADLTPKLGLDLEGGTQMILRPRPGDAGHDPAGASVPKSEMNVINRRPKDR